MDGLKRSAVPGAGSGQLQNRGGANPALADELRCILCPQRPGDIASVVELVIRCLEKDLALSQELVANLAVACLLVRIHRQQEVGQLFLELPKNRFLLWSAAPSEKDALTAWISTPSRPSSPRSFLSTARSWFSPKAWQAWL